MVKPHLACHKHHLINDPDKQTCGNHGPSSPTEDWVGHVTTTHPEDSEIATEMDATEPSGYTLEVH